MGKYVGPVLVRWFETWIGFPPTTLGKSLRSICPETHFFQPQKSFITEGVNFRLDSLHQVDIESAVARVGVLFDEGVQQSWYSRGCSSTVIR